MALVLIAFVAVGLWFAYRVRELGRGDPPVVFDGPSDSMSLPFYRPDDARALSLLAHAQSVEAVQHALDSGDIKGAVRAFDIRPENQGWEVAYLRRQTERLLFESPAEAVGEGADEPFPRSCFLAALAGEWAAPSGGNAAVSRDGRLVAVGRARSVLLRDTSAALPRYLPGSRLGDGPLAFSGDGRRLIGAVNTNDRVFEGGKEVVLPGKFRVWDTATGRLLFAIEVPGGTISKVALTRDGDLAATLSEDGMLRVWDLSSRQITLPGDNTRPLAVTFEPEGTTLTVLGADGKLRRWNAWTSRRLPDVCLPGFDGKTAALHPGGDLVAAVGVDGKVRVWDARTAKMPRLFSRPGDRGSEGLAFSPDGKTLACVAEEGVRWWEVASGEERPILQPERRRRHHTAVAFGPRVDQLIVPIGGRFIRWDEDSPAAVWKSHLQDGQRLRSLLVNVSNSRLIAVDGERALIGWETNPNEWHQSDRVKDPDLEEGSNRRLTHTFLRRLDDPIRHALLTPDGSRLVVLCEGGRLLVLDPKTCTRLASFRTAADASLLAFSRDGQCLAVACDDGSARLLDATPPASR